MSPSNKFIYGSILIGTCAVLCVAIVAQAQYNNYDNSDSNSDSDGGQTMSNAELGKLVRNSAAAAARAHGSGQGAFRNQHHQQQLAATRNLYNRQQPMQFAPTQHNRRQFGADGLAGYGPMMGGASQHARQASNANNNDDDDESGNFGPNFNANFDGGDNDGESNANQGAEGQSMNLNQAASGYPSQGDYNENAAGFNGFGPSSGAGYGPSLDGSEFGPSDGYSGAEGRRAKSASSLMGSRNYNSDDDAGAPQYGPNSAVNSGDNDDEGRAGYAPEAGNDNEGDDE